MNLEDEFDLSLSPVHQKKSAPKQGRRAAIANAFGDEDQAASIVAASADLSFGSPLKAKPNANELLLDDDDGGQRPPPPRHPGGRRTGGWADERVKTAKSVRIQSAAMMAYRDPESDDDDDDGELPVIPDLDVMQEEDLALQVATAPSVSVNRVATYRELDSDLLKQVAFATLDDIDLKLLTPCLWPETELREPDEPWSWDVVFAQVSGELQREWHPEQEEEERQQATKERPYTAFNRFPV